MTLRVCFFASLREQVGFEEISIAAESWRELNDQLRSVLPEEGYAAILAENVRIAADQTLCDGSFLELIEQPTSLTATEIAFLPPVTGG